MTVIEDLVGAEHASPLRTTNVPKLSVEGYEFWPGPEFRFKLKKFSTLADQEAFTQSWSTTVEDRFMRDGGRYRKRTYGVYWAEGDEISRREHRPHYQASEHNTLNGGVERWFEPISSQIGSGPSMMGVLALCRDSFERLSPIRKWHIEVHQFRIEVRKGEIGKPTPEGIHRDGVDFGIVMMVGRKNVAGGETAIFNMEGDLLQRATLRNPFDALLMNDANVMHGVSPIEPLDHAQIAIRDVLVVTFSSEVR